MSATWQNFQSAESSDTFIASNCHQAAEWSKMALTLLLLIVVSSKFLDASSQDGKAKGEVSILGVYGNVTKTSDARVLTTSLPKTFAS